MLLKVDSEALVLALGSLLEMQTLRSFPRPTVSKSIFELDLWVISLHTKFKRHGFDYNWLLNRLNLRC